MSVWYCMWNTYTYSSIKKFRSCCHKCMKTFFGYHRMCSVTAILLELPSFDTLLHNYSENPVIMQSLNILVVLDSNVFYVFCVSLVLCFMFFPLMFSLSPFTLLIKAFMHRVMSIMTPWNPLRNQRNVKGYLVRNILIFILETSQG